MQKHDAQKTYQEIPSGWRSKTQSHLYSKAIFCSTAAVLLMCEPIYAQTPRADTQASATSEQTPAQRPGQSQAPVEQPGASNSAQSTSGVSDSNAAALIQDLQRSTAILRARTEEAKAREALEIVLRNAASAATPTPVAPVTPVAVPAPAPAVPAAPSVRVEPREPVRPTTPDRTRPSVVPNPPTVMVIYGRDKVLQASLRLANGFIVDVREGDELDDGSRVKVITSKRVIIEVEGQRVTLLTWSGTASNTSPAPNVSNTPRAPGMPPGGPGPRNP